MHFNHLSFKLNFCLSLQKKEFVKYVVSGRKGKKYGLQKHSSFESVSESQFLELILNQFDVYFNYHDGV